MESEQAEGVPLWKRIVNLDDLLHIASRANASLDILTARRDPHTATDSPLTEAIRLHLEIAEKDPRWAARGHAKLHAARIAQLGHEMPTSMRHLAVVDVDPTKLFFEATQEFAGSGLIRDLTSETVAEHEYTQSLRLGENCPSAKARASRTPEQFAGTGAEIYRGMFEFEYTVACLETNSLDQVRDHLRESDNYWATDERAQYWAAGRGRHEFACSLLSIYDDRLGDALTHLSIARELLTKPSWNDERAVEELSMALATAACSAAAWNVGDPTDVILAACGDALRHLEHIRGRWGVVARSPIAPAAVLRIVLGELARIVARIATPDNSEASRMGLRIALAAKQSGYAELVRAERTLLDDSLAVLLEEIVKLEQLPDTALQTDVEKRYLDDLRADLTHASSPLLADLVLPQSVAIAPLLDCVRDCVTLDYVHLPLADGSETWFRTTIEGAKRIAFEELAMDAGYRMLFEDDGSPAHRGLIDRFERRQAGRSPGWALAADELLPESVLERLRQPKSEEPLELLISPHKQLSRIPWNALVVGNELDGRRIRLVERAVVAQVPMLSTLLEADPEPVNGAALVWLTHGVTNEREQSAWRLPPGTLVARCEIPAASHATRVGSLAENLAAGDWGLAYVACHGEHDGGGLRQLIQVGDQLTAARALSLPWPPNVVLAACHVGLIDDTGEGEPLGFVIAALARGARTVVAGLNRVSKIATGEIGGRLIERLDGRTRLDHALRGAQLAYLRDNPAADDLLWEWAMLTAFVR